VKENDSNSVRELVSSFVGHILIEMKIQENRLVVRHVKLLIVLPRQSLEQLWNLQLSWHIYAETLLTLPCLELL
jgi:hypothetical protein